MISLCFQSCILIVGIIPRKDRRIVIAVLSSIQIDSGRSWRNDLPVRDLRSKIISGIGVLQLIIIVRLAVGILIFRKLPENRADLQTVPFEILTDLICRDQISLVVNDIVLVLFLCFIPYTGVYDDLLAFLNFADADLLCNICNKVVVLDDG